ncbi:MAG: hypothetical protein OK454_08940 [Thaumarchaeota archaeon]|nr:hypothetical protein [Nitrososphaerota archaeon]
MSQYLGEPGSISKKSNGVALSSGIIAVGNIYDDSSAGDVRIYC